MFLKTTKVAALVSALLIVGCNEKEAKTASDAKPAAEQAKSTEVSKTISTDGMTEEQNISYAIGANSGGYIAKTMERYSMAEFTVDSDLAAQGFADALKGTSKIEEKKVREILTAFTQKMETARKEKDKAVAEENKKKGTDFLSKNKGIENVITLDSGLQYKVMVEGKGEKPKSTDTVKVHYKGTLIDGTEFDSSFKRQKPAEFPVTGVIKGWVEALQLMNVGSKWQLFIPPELAYGSTSRPSIPGNSVLIFEVELLDIVKKEEKEEKVGAASGHKH